MSIEYKYLKIIKIQRKFIGFALKIYLKII